ncbi:S-layer homology domain-containing protein [Paenibacillus sp. NRS-1760]|uniref:S-layer homology domain-containing protein n=1 Tax=Paenibacillus sp. NRS-1760 TaxID=3233902 RepID=UPI003D26BFFD
MKKYDSVSSDWVTLGSAGFSEGEAYYPSLYVAADGTPYVAYIDWGISPKAMVKKYDSVSSDWVTVGSDGSLASSAHYTSLYVDNGTPYVAYMDEGNSSKATVKKYDSVSSDWVTVGNAGFSAGEAHYTSLYVDNGTPYVAYQDLGNSSKVTVMSLNTVNASPSLTADTTDNDNLNDIEITFADDETWRGEITAVKDGENPLLETDYTISAGMITINAGVLSKGSHTIKIKATGYSHATVVQNMLHFYTGEGTGLESDPYQIATADQLNQVRYYLDSGIFFKLTADIDLSGYQAGEGWLPIGDWDTWFKGNMDGNGYTITGLTINRPNHDIPVGLFGYAENSVLSNMKLENVNIIGDEIGNTVGGLVGYIDNGTVSSSYVTGSVSGADVGGLVGWNDETNISGSYFTGSMNGANNVGGLVGRNYGTVSNSYATGSVSGTLNNVGGLVGWNDGTVSNSYATGSVSGSSEVGGLLGYNKSGTISNSFYDSIITSEQLVNGIGIRKTTAEMQTSSTFTDWDFESVWYLVSEQYPQLWAFTALTPGTDYLTTKLIKVANGMEYSLNDVDYTAITGTYADNIIVNAGDTVYVRVAADPSSAITLTVDITNINTTIEPIATSAIAGVTAPVIGATPAATVTETMYYTGTVTWLPAVTTTFAAGTAYTATITLTPKAGYTLIGVDADFFTVAGATTTNMADSGVVTAVFPATAAADTSSSGGGGPSTGDVPVKVGPIDTTTEIKLSDISGHWAETGIKQAVSIGFIKGYVDGTFKPNQTVTRAEFSVMLMNALKPEGAGVALTFTDTVKIGTWAQKAVAQAVQAGIINGYKDGTFLPNAKVTRSEMAVMIANALKLNIESDTVTSFADDKSIPSWAKGAVAELNKLSLMVGSSSNQFNPKAQATRAEAVTVLLNMLEQENK